MSNRQKAAKKIGLFGCIANGIPAETAQVLEYWMDDSLFSEWDPTDLVEVPWDNGMFLDDIDTYASYGIRNIMCYCVYVGPSYVNKFGFPAFLEEYGQGLLNYER